MWTSSIIKTLHLPCDGIYFALSNSSRILSTWVCEAASSSTTSSIRPAVICSHISHVRHGAPSMVWRQLTIFATIRARVVFPTPRVPVNRKAWCRRFCRTAFWRTRAVYSCPTKSANVCGRHLRASDRNDGSVFIKS